MKPVLFTLTFLLFISFLKAQVTRSIDTRSFNEDSIELILEHAPMDTNRVNLLCLLAQSYFFKQPETSFHYSTEALNLSRELDFTPGIQNALFRGGEAKRAMGDFIGALKIQFEALELNQKLNDKDFEATSLGTIGLNYFGLSDYVLAIYYLKKALSIQKYLQPKSIEILFCIYTANCYSLIEKPDSAFFYHHEAGIKLNNYKISGPQLKILHNISLGNTYSQINNLDSARMYYSNALVISIQNKDNTPNAFCMVTSKLSELFYKENQLDSCLYYASHSFQLAKEKGLSARILESSRILSKYYRTQGNPDSALFYYDLATQFNDSIYGQKKISELQLLVLKEQRRNLDIQDEIGRSQDRLLFGGLISIIVIIMAAGVVLYRSNRAKHKANLILENTISKLRATQSQLIHAEKMASLGELTAGIAHEIQNPLNFVNNFSEVNKELLEELKAQSLKLKELEIKSEIDELVKNINDNLEKTVHHGKRADSIVKGMLQHSRASTGQKEPTDINALADEYLRLSYHGFRAKDKSFNATMRTDFDSSIGNINIVPQDIGRVLLNLINNAFFAVSEKKKSNPDNYEPLVSISTSRAGSPLGLPDRNGMKAGGRGSDGQSIEIVVKDNGTGIPENNKEKIFQPFFTTKPAGQGTGLGLSLSYDIIKAHGGELKLESAEIEGSQFKILLPA